jgi:3',5'-cyclic AMP phosphodiesterase CpdA
MIDSIPQNGTQWRPFTGPATVVRVTLPFWTEEIAQSIRVVVRMADECVRAEVQTISVLQIGDVHFPDSRDKRLLDLKDKSMDALVANAAPRTLTKVVRTLAKIISQERISALLLCGDLTTAGDLPNYSECVKYLVEVLRLNSTDKNNVHVVPGNHDVSRTLCTDRGALNPQKFAPLQTAWTDNYEDIIVTQGVRGSEVNEDSRSVRIMSLNSCIGCGEWRMLPENIREELSEVLTALRNRDPKAAFAIEGQQLDTPMFDNDDIEELHSQIKSLDSHIIPVVLAHHNLLPQQLLRVELYTELINSGQLRSALSSIGRPIVYCHGHIHKDPIESISDGSVRNSQLICVSAPLLEDGFNELKFYFSRTNAPLGLEVIGYRLDTNGTICDSSRRRIPFVNRAKFLTSELECLRGCLTGDRMRFGELQKTMGSANSIGVDDANLAELLHEAEWLGMLEIDNMNEKPQYWIVRRRWA